MRQPGHALNRYRHKSDRRTHKPRRNGTPTPGTSSSRASNTIRLRQKRCASDGSPTNLHRAKSLCSFGMHYTSNLAISRIREYDYLVETSPSSFQAPACLVDRNAVKETDAHLCVSQAGQDAPWVTTTDGTNNAIVWVVGSEDGGDQRLHGYNGDTGAVVYAAGQTS